MEDPAYFRSLATRLETKAVGMAAVGLHDTRNLMIEGAAALFACAEHLDLQPTKPERPRVMKGIIPAIILVIGGAMIAFAIGLSLSQAS